MINIEERFNDRLNEDETREIILYLRDCFKDVLNINFNYSDEKVYSIYEYALTPNTIKVNYNPSNAIDAESLLKGIRFLYKVLKLSPNRSFAINLTNLLGELYVEGAKLIFNHSNRSKEIGNLIALQFIYALDISPIKVMVINKYMQFRVLNQLIINE